MVLAPRRWLWFFLPLAVLALVPVVWGYECQRLEARFDERLAELRRTGVLKTWDDLDRAPPAREKNGWALLEEAARLRLAVDNDETEIGGPVMWPPMWFEDCEWDEADWEAYRRYEKRLRPYDAKLEEALEAPLVASPLLRPFGHTRLFPITQPCSRWHERAEMDPSLAGRSADRIATLTGAWRVQNALEFCVHAAFWRTALDLLRTGLRDGHVDTERLPTWIDRIAAADARLPEGLRFGLETNRAALLAELDIWRRDEDASATIERLSRESLDFIFQEPWEEGYGEPPTRPNTAWHRRPWLLRDLNTSLESLASTPARWSAPMSRTLLDEALDPAFEWQRITASALLHTLSAMRLARIGIAAYLEGPADDTIAARGAQVAKRLGGSLPDDPVTGRPFAWERVDGEHVIVGSGACLMTPTDDRTELEEEGLLWRVR